MDHDWSSSRSCRRSKQMEEPDESVYIGVPIPRSYRRKRRHRKHTSRHSHERQRHHSHHGNQDTEEPCDPEESRDPPEPCDPEEVEPDSNELSEYSEMHVSKKF